MKNASLLSRCALPALVIAAAATALVYSNTNAQDGPGGVFKMPEPGAVPGADAPGAATPAPARPAVNATPAPIIPSPTGDTIVNANQTVQSYKRGVCENRMSGADFQALAKGVSWYYNWAASTADVAPGNSMEFIPMAWGHPGDPGAVGGALGRRPRAVLALNEPNLKGQAFLVPEAAADFYRKVKQTADAQHIPVVGPNMALGSATGDSIKAKDPVTGKDTVYTSMNAYLDAFGFFLKKTDTQAGSMGVHSYNGMGDLKGAVGNMYQRTQKPVWVTEFAFWHAKDEQDELKYLQQAVEYMENSQQVAAYAWFMNRSDKNPLLNLLDKQSGKLTPLGEEYVKLPGHSRHVFYRIPGLLDAGKYVAREDMTLEDTTDAGGDFDMVSAGPAWIEYNLQVDQPGTYVLKLRVSGAPGKIDVMQNGQVLGSAETTETQWHAVETSVTLLAGTQTLRFSCNGQTLHSIEFVEKAGVAMK